MDRKESELDTRAAKELSRSEAKPDSRIEALLEQGEDLFERGLLGQAIHLWTRVLFLDRGNRQARGRIDEAKGLLAERQRLLEARLVDARHLFEEGEVEEARALLRSVLNIDVHHADAVRLSEDMAAFDRRMGVGVGVALGEPAVSQAARDESRDSELDDAAESESEAGREPEAEAVRPSKAFGPPAPGVGLLLRVSRRSVQDAASPPASPLKVGAFLLVVGMAFTTGGLFLYHNWESIVSDGTAAGVAVDGTRATGERVGAGGSSEGWPRERRATVAPDLSELRYYNGARLFDKGRYREALAELERVDRGSAVTSRARGLILRIEERLLRGAEEPDTEDQEH